MKVLKRLISCIIVVALLLGVLFCATNLFQKKESDIKYHQFFEHAEDYDVLFVGSSHVINGILPLELFNDYGIASYNFGGHSAQVATSYWGLKNALDYAKPKVVVIDCFNISFQQKTSNNFSYVHMTFDMFPLTLNKVRAVNDLLDDKEIERKIKEGEIEENEKRTKLGLLWDYSVYHSRWEELDENDFEVKNNIEYGAESRIYIAEPGKESRDSGRKLEGETVGLTYLRKMITECKENGMQVVLTYLPYPIEGDYDWTEINRLYDIANEYNVDYINFHDLNVVDYQTDLCDPYSHLNIAGAIKVSDYLGEYLRSHFQLPDRRQDIYYNYWYDDYKAYEDLKLERIKAAGDLNTYLMFLADKNYGYVIGVDDPSIFEDDTTMALLRNKGVKVEEINEDTHYIVVCGDVTQVINSYINDYGDYGEVSIYFGDDNKYGIYKDGQEVNYLSTTSLSLIDGAVYISVFDMDNKNEIIDISTFKKRAPLGPNDRELNDEGIYLSESLAKRYF